MLKQLFALSLVTICAKAACGDPVPSYESNKVLYDYRVNGADWGTIHNVKFPVCASGLEQSPIDLKTNAPNDDEIVLISSGYFDINLDQQFLHSDTGKKVSFDSASRSKAAMYLAFPNSQYDDRPLPEYNPLQFHFHAPSEHTVDGDLMDLEIHFVHALSSDANQYAVVGFFFDVEKGGDQENPFITSLLDAMS